MAKWDQEKRILYHKISKYEALMKRVEVDGKTIQV